MRYNPLLFCIDPADLVVQGVVHSENKFNLHINFKIPPEHCRNGEYDSQCVTNAEFEKQFNNKTLYLWNNRKRINLMEYSAESPVIEESFIRVISMPVLAKTMIYSVHMTEIVREDNLLMALEGITEIEDSLFDIIHDFDLDRILTLEENTRL